MHIYLKIVLTIIKLDYMVKVKIFTNCRICGRNDWLITMKTFTYMIKINM